MSGNKVNEDIVSLKITEINHIMEYWLVVVNIVEIVTDISFTSSIYL